MARRLSVFEMTSDPHSNYSDAQKNLGADASMIEDRFIDK
jgi:hypothetical protein